MGLKKTVMGDPGGSKGKTESGNHAWDSINGAFKPALGYVTDGGNAVKNLLGIGTDGAGQKAALEQFSESSGMGFLRDQINNQVTSNKAASGLLNSGSTLTALQDRGAQLGSTYLNQYMQNLFGLGNLGLGAGGVMADAGRWSKGEQSSSGPKKGILGSLSDVAENYAKGTSG